MRESLEDEAVPGQVASQTSARDQEGVVDQRSCEKPPISSAHLKKESLGYNWMERNRVSMHHSSRSLRRFYRGFYNAFKKEKPSPRRACFNPEEPANRKREWLQLRAQRNKAPGWPEHNFEHLVIVGIPPTADIVSMSNEISHEALRRKHSGVQASLPSRQSEKPHHNPPKPSYVPELLYQFPEEKPLHMSPDELVSFCFPDGVTPRLLSRSSSLSALNEIVYGQQHMVQSDQSFVFLQKGGDDLPMFGICYYVNQMVHTPPGLARQSFSEQKLPLTRYLVAAPRCYCILSRYPFFDLHFQVLNLILGLERLDIIREYVDEVAALPPRQKKMNDGCSSDCQSMTPASSIFPASTPEPQLLNRNVSVSPSPPSSARKSESGILRPFAASPAPMFRRRSFSMDPLARPREVSRGRSPQIQDSFSSIPGLHKLRRHDATASMCPKDPGGRSAGVRERADKISGQSGSSPSDNQATTMVDPSDNKSSIKDFQNMSTPFLMDAPSVSMHDLQGTCQISDPCDGRAMDAREISLDPGSCLPDEKGDPLKQSREIHAQNHWLHARSISGQSLREYDTFDGPNKAAVQVDMPVITVPSHCRGDSAFYGLEFHSLPLLRGRSGTPPVMIGGHFGESEMCTNRSLSSPTSPWWPIRRSNSHDAMSIGGASLSSMYFRSPSCHEIYSRGITPPLLWRGDVEGSGSRLTAAQSVLYSFHSMPVPVPGERIVFAPEEGLQTIEYCRPLLKNSEQGTSASNQRIDPKHLGVEVAQIEAEAACELRVWTVASLCRSLSLENILSLLVAAMFEKQIVFFCSNIGILTSSVLSLIPLLRPFTWQSLLMPVVPTRLLDLLDAPVPFAVGLQHKTQEVAQRCGDLVRVNLYKDSIKNSPPASSLPGYRHLLNKLAPVHKLLHQKGSHAKRPMHIPTSTEASAVESFLLIFTDYLQKLVGDLRRHTITEVGKDGLRVCLLLEESLVESFPQKDWPFMKAFVQTQMFSSFSDAVISSFE